MSDDLVKRLWQLDMHPESAPRQAADRIESLEAVLAKADELANALCAEEQTAGQDVWVKLDACEVTDKALAAYHQARAALNREADT